MTPVLHGSFQKFFIGLKKLDRSDNEPELVKKKKPDEQKEVVKPSVSGKVKDTEVVKPCVSGKGKPSTESPKAQAEKRASRTTKRTYEQLPEPDQTKILKEPNFLCVFNTYKQLTAQNIVLTATKDSGFFISKITLDGAEVSSEKDNIAIKSKTMAILSYFKQHDPTFLEVYVKDEIRKANIQSLIGFDKYKKIMY